MIQSETLKFFDEFCSYKIAGAGPILKDILIIDDEMLVTKTLGNLLKKERFLNIVIANNGLVALEKIKTIRHEKNKEFDLIICDIRMPELDGIETIRRAKK
jgi:two-component system response regulator HydG